MPPIRTGWVPAKTLGELLRRTRACLGIENPTVFQPCLEIIGRCLDDHSRLETLRLYPLEYFHTKVVNEAQRMTACRPDVDMSALGVFVTKPFDGCLDIENALPFLQESSRRPSRLIPMSKRWQPIARSWTRTRRSTITTDFSARCLRSASIIPEPVEQRFSTTHQNQRRPIYLAAVTRWAPANSDNCFVSGFTAWWLALGRLRSTAW